MIDTLARVLFFCSLVLSLSAILVDADPEPGLGLKCNEEVCASIVSKCMLTQSCKCSDLKSNATCHRDCFKCLDYLFTECCSCVGHCPPPEDNETQLNTKSAVDSLSEPSPDLFNVLTEEKDRLLRWISFTFPVQLSFVTSVGSDPKVIKFGTGTKVTMRTDGIDQEEDVTVNCTVAYMSQCMSLNKCKSSCRSMGSSAYRWFHDGCCECVGSNCVDYGIKESRCLQCPVREDEETPGIDADVEEPEAQPTFPDHGMEDYEVGPQEEDDERQENVVKKQDPEEIEKHKQNVEGDLLNVVPKKPAL